MHAYKGLILIKAKKKFGQNFLKDESVVEKIIQAMPNDGRMIVEIGPGLGDLTKKLLQKCEKVAAFEIDLELCGFLQEKFSKEISIGHFELICDDVLEQWKENELLKQPYHLVANLPYYIATNIILRALEDVSCQTIIVMIQKEVALKFASRVREKSYSALSILADTISDVEVLFDVGSECFDPPPKVTSAVLKLTKFSSYIKTDHHDGLFEDESKLDGFKAFLRVAFAAPRKTLMKNLLQIASKDRLIEIFEDFEIPTQIRPHELKSQQYHLLFKKI